MATNDDIFDDADEFVSRRRKWYGRPYTREYKDRKDRMDRFLEAFEETDAITMAADAADVSVGTVFDWKNRDQEFALRFEEARMRYRDKIAGQVRKGALTGFTKTKIDKDGCVHEYEEVSERMVELEAKRVDKSYRERSDVEVIGGITPVVVVPAQMTLEQWVAEAEKLRDQYKDKGLM